MSSKGNILYSKNNFKQSNFFDLLSIFKIVYVSLFLLALKLFFLFPLILTTTFFRLDFKIPYTTSIQVFSVIANAPSIPSNSKNNDFRLVEFFKTSPRTMLSSVVRLTAQR